MESTNTVKIKGEKLADILDFIKSNKEVKTLTKKLTPSGVSVNAGKDFVEITILFTKNGISDLVKTK